MTKIFSSSLFSYAILIALSIGLIDMVRDTLLLEGLNIFAKSVLLTIYGVAGLFVLALGYFVYRLDNPLKKENVND